MIKNLNGHPHGVEEQAPADANQHPARFSCSLADLQARDLAVLSASSVIQLKDSPNRIIKQIALGLVAELSARIAEKFTSRLEVNFDGASREEIVNAMAFNMRVYATYPEEEPPYLFLKGLCAALEKELFRRWQRNEDLPAQITAAERLN